MDDFEKDVLDLKKELENIKSAISKINSVNISNKQLLERINEIAKIWFKKIRNNLRFYVTDETIASDYDKLFERLLSLSYKANRKKSVLEVIDNIQKHFTEDVLMPIQMNNTEIQASELFDILLEIKNVEENEYMREAIECAEAKHFRAAVILGWCATIDRIHKVIADNGFEKFSQKTLEMKEQKAGRFKRFNKSYIVTNMSEMQEVFDNDVLLVLEAMGYIDNNQHARLSSCYNMRCNCGHPGEAPMTKYNVMSFFSDIIEIIFKNKKFIID